MTGQRKCQDSTEKFYCAVTIVSPISCITFSNTIHMYVSGLNPIRPTGPGTMFAQR